MNRIEKLEKSVKNLQTSLCCVNRTLTTNDIDVFLIGGQSNAQGQGDSSLSPIPTTDTVYQYYNSLITQAQDPIGNAETGSAWTSFGIKWNKLTGRRICFVPAAVSSSAQVAAADIGPGNWDTTGTLFDTSVTLLNDALAALTAAGYNPLLRGILWSQGERDAGAITSATITKAQYKSALTTMIANYRTEFGSTDDQPFWQQSYRQNFMALARSAIHAGLDILSLSYATHSTNGYGSTVYDFFNYYAGIRNVSESNRGFCAFRDEIDILDTERFPVNPYGVVVTQNVNQFNNQIASIVSSECVLPNYDNCRSPELIETSITDTYLRPGTGGVEYRYLNPARIQKIRDAFPGATYRTVTSAQQLDSYNSPYSADTIPDNYYRFLRQYSPNTTSIGGWNKGPTSGYYGRYTRGFDLTKPNPKIFMIADEGLDSGDDNEVVIKVIYYDNGTGMFGINCATCKGECEIGIVQKKNSNTFVTKIITVNKFLFGGNLENGSDIILKYLSGDNTFFDSIEIINNSKIV